MTNDRISIIRATPAPPHLASPSASRLQIQLAFIEESSCLVMCAGWRGGLTAETLVSCAFPMLSLFEVGTGDEWGRSTSDVYYYYYYVMKIFDYYSPQCSYLVPCSKTKSFFRPASYWEVFISSMQGSHDTSNRQAVLLYLLFCGLNFSIVLSTEYFFWGGGGDVVCI